MKKRLMKFGGCLFALVLTTTIVINSAAEARAKKRPPKPAPEPVSSVLFAAGGGAFVGLRYLRRKWKSKEVICQQNDARDGIT